MTYSTKSYGVQEVSGERDARILLASFYFLYFSPAFSSCFLAVRFSLPVTSFLFFYIVSRHSFDSRFANRSLSSLSLLAPGPFWLCIFYILFILVALFISELLSIEGSSSDRNPIP
ncbi:hypothetical protein MAP00_001089 [Monascus purpureus]|nr:hypothetical protein MAP00_001089 [Monascus purpureus]